MSKKNNKDISNEELCATVAKLKFQLLDARFRLLSGQLEKVHLIGQIRHMIAQILTELAQRGYKASIGSHGVTLYDLNNNNKVQVITNKNIEQFVDKQVELEKAMIKNANAKTKTKPIKTQGVLKEIKKEGQVEGGK